MKQSKRSLTLCRRWPAIIVSSLPILFAVLSLGGTGRWSQLFKIETILSATFFSLWTSAPFLFMYALSNRISYVRRAFYPATIPGLMLTIGLWAWTVRDSYLHHVQAVEDNGESGMGFIYALLLFPGCIFVLMLLIVLLTIPFQSGNQN